MKKLLKKWAKAKVKLNQAKAAELDLREQVRLAMTKDEIAKAEVKQDSEIFVLKSNKNYYIPSGAMVDIKANLDRAIFPTVFAVSYRIKEKVYENLSGKCKKIIKKHLTIKDAPLSVTVKEA